MRLSYEHKVVYLRKVPPKRLMSFIDSKYQSSRTTLELLTFLTLISKTYVTTFKFVDRIVFLCELL